ncbi:hypothetical protein BVRB_4g095780 [Beta vulgaris subsp. vulgaris]|uniref:Uncharacterized protein n=1 Tax=Beta vulgaris subsp. vulgaris TaxID=3555 RepID=A0A0J8B9X0_BETVV|nr:hypothetical protein BVRB_4g095780 [Beta vulgaris subsp. vulgaris]
MGLEKGGGAGELGKDPGGGAGVPKTWQRASSLPFFLPRK